MASSKQNFVCTLCLEPFEKPKILPCIHTFCEKCLRTLVSKQRSQKQFPCPNCRKIIPVPNGGVGAFPTNIYIDSDELKAAREQYTCKTHPKNELVSYCTSCDEAICVECMLGKHKPHDITTIRAEAASSKEQLDRDNTRLKIMLDALKGLERKSEQNQRTLKQCTEEVKAEIKKRCTELMCLAEKHRDAQLAALGTITTDLNNDNTKWNAEMVAATNTKRTGLSTRQQGIQDILDHGRDLQIIMMARETKADLGSQDAMLALFPADWPAKLRVSDVPSLQTDQLQTADDISRLVNAVIGRVTTRRVLQLQVDLHLSEMIQCSRCDMYFFAVSGNGDVCVSFEQSGMPVLKFSNGGRLIDIVMEITGKVTMQYMASGECLYITADPASDQLAICAKSNHLYVFEHRPPNQGIVQKVEIRGTKAFVTDWVPLLTLNCGHCLAFDTNDSGTQFAVLEQQPDRSTCVVKIYNMSVPEPVHSFELGSSPRADICFYVAKGKEVLLVTDESHSRVLAFSMESSRLTPVIPMSSLMHPVALNTDTAGRVWIGCKDGRIFTCDNLVKFWPSKRDDAVMLTGYHIIWLALPLPVSVLVDKTPVRHHKRQVKFRNVVVFWMDATEPYSFSSKGVGSGQISLLNRRKFPHS